MKEWKLYKECSSHDKERKEERNHILHSRGDSRHCAIYMCRRDAARMDRFAGFRCAVGPHRAAHLILDQVQDKINKTHKLVGHMDVISKKEIISSKVTVKNRISKDDCKVVERSPGQLERIKMMKGTLTIKSADGRFVIEQEQDQTNQDSFIITIYEEGRCVFSTSRKTESSPGELTKTLEGYIRMFR